MRIEGAVEFVYLIYFHNRQVMTGL